jgi:hypothetical protein
LLVLGDHVRVDREVVRHLEDDQRAVGTDAEALETTDHRGIRSDSRLTEQRAKAADRRLSEGVLDNLRIRKLAETKTGPYRLSRQFARRHMIVRIVAAPPIRCHVWTSPLPSPLPFESASVLRSASAD